MQLYFGWRKRYVITPKGIPASFVKLRLVLPTSVQSPCIGLVTSPWGTRGGVGGRGVNLPVHGSIPEFSSASQMSHPPLTSCLYHRPSDLLLKGATSIQTEDIFSTALWMGHMPSPVGCYTCKSLILHVLWSPIHSAGLGLTVTSLGTTVLPFIERPRQKPPWVSVRPLHPLPVIGSELLNLSHT